MGRTGWLQGQERVMCLLYGVNGHRVLGVAAYVAEMNNGPAKRSPVKLFLSEPNELRHHLFPIAGGDVGLTGLLEGRFGQ